MNQSFSCNKWVAVAIALLLTFSLRLTPAEKEKVKPRAFLGITISSLSQEELKELKIDHGIRVIGVEAGQAADKAGIRKKDIIQFIDEKKIASPDDLVAKIKSAAPGSKVSIKLIREGKTIEMKAILGQRDENDDQWISKRDIKLPFISKNRWYLGVQVIPLNSDLASYFFVKPDEGVLVLDIDNESPAQKAGLKPGDVIVKVNGKGVKSASDIREALDANVDGKSQIAIVRHGKPMSLTAEAEKKKSMKFYRHFGDSGDCPFFNPRHLHSLLEQIGEMAEIWSDHAIDGDGGRIKIRIERELGDRMKHVESQMENAEEKIQAKAKKIRKEVKVKIVATV